MHSWLGRGIEVWQASPGASTLQAWALVTLRQDLLCITGHHPRPEARALLHIPVILALGRQKQGLRRPRVIFGHSYMKPCFHAWLATLDLICLPWALGARTPLARDAVGTGRRWVRFPLYICFAPAGSGCQRGQRPALAGFWEQEARRSAGCRSHPLPTSQARSWGVACASETSSPSYFLLSEYEAGPWNTARQFPFRP